MENSQRHWLIGCGAALGLWVAYRVIKKLPMLPMKDVAIPATPAPATTGASSNFTGYYNAATGDAGSSGGCNEIMTAIVETEKMLMNINHMSPSAVTSLRNRLAALKTKAVGCGDVHSSGVNPSGGEYKGFTGDFSQYLDTIKWQYH